MLKLEITRRKDSLLLQIPKISAAHKTLAFSSDMPALKVIIDAESFSPSKKNPEKFQKQIPLDEIEVDLSSQAIEFVNYLPNEKALIVNFWHNQGCYLYYDIPETLYALLLIAESKGSFFHKIIQKKYSFKKIPSEFTVFDVKQAIQEERAEALEDVTLNMKEIYNQVSSPEALHSYWNQAQSTLEKVQLLQNPYFPISKVLEEIKADYWLSIATLAINPERRTIEIEAKIQQSHSSHQLISAPKEIKQDFVSIIVPQFASFCTNIRGLNTIPEVVKQTNSTLKKGQALMRMDTEGNLELVDYRLNY